MKPEHQYLHLEMGVIRFKTHCELDIFVTTIEIIGYHIISLRKCFKLCKCQIPHIECDEDYSINYLKLVSNTSF